MKNKYETPNYKVMIYYGIAWLQQKNPEHFDENLSNIQG